MDLTFYVPYYCTLNPSSNQWAKHKVKTIHTLIIILRITLCSSSKKMISKYTEDLPAVSYGSLTVMKEHESQVFQNYSKKTNRGEKNNIMGNYDSYVIVNFMSCTVRFIL